MDKVEAYRCEECKGTKGKREDVPKIAGRRTWWSSEWFDCGTCKGTGIVWLIEEEVRDKELIADHESKDSGCCGTGCGEGCIG